MGVLYLWWGECHAHIKLSTPLITTNFAKQNIVITQLIKSKIGISTRSHFVRSTSSLSLSLSLTLSLALSLFFSISLASHVFILDTQRKIEREDELDIHTYIDTLIDVV